MKPKHLITEKETVRKNVRDAHFTRHTHSLLTGWLISQTLGFWSAVKLFFSIFRPGAGPASADSFRHMDSQATLSIENTDGEMSPDGLQIGFTVNEMADRMEGLLRSVGLTEVTPGLVYFIGHGASSVNNTHYAGYDCGACSGRPGSVNARVAAYMCNHAEVRSILADRGIHIGKDTVFIGALHDTTRDEIRFYDTEQLPAALKEEHQRHLAGFEKALDLNAKERSRRFLLTDSHGDPSRIHRRIIRRSVSLFEPRPELNHATNAVCIVGPRELSKGLFLDRRAFLNSYDCRKDPEGRWLSGILRAVAPVCGGINLEYYFSRTDPQRLGAGSKLPHNVMGLLGVANGTDGDLRTGLPEQMTEMHDPVRLMVVAEAHPDVLLDAVSKEPATLEWFTREWIHLYTFDPDSGHLFGFNGEKFEPVTLPQISVKKEKNIVSAIEESDKNLEVMLLEGHGA